MWKYTSIAKQTNQILLLRYNKASSLSFSEKAEMQEAWQEFFLPQFWEFELFLYLHFKNVIKKIYADFCNLHTPPWPLTVHKKEKENKRKKNLYKVSHSLIVCDFIVYTSVDISI